MNGHIHRLDYFAIIRAGPSQEEEGGFQNEAGVQGPPRQLVGCRVPRLGGGSGRENVAFER